SLYGSQGSEAQYPGLDERRQGRSREYAWIVANAGHSDGELPEVARLRLPFSVRNRRPWRGSGGARFARIADVALAGLRSEEDFAGVHHGPRREREAILSGEYSESEGMVAAVFL